MEKRFASAVASVALCCAAAVRATPQGAPERPRDPWVFRSALDGRPRMVALALHDELWVAYDATWCSFYKAWRGGVDLDEAGTPEPRPTTQGAAYLDDGPAGLVWWIARAGEAVAAEPVWRGYAFEDGHVQLRYELVHPDGTRIAIQESPEFVRPEQLYDDPASAAPWLRAGMVGLRRTFVASSVPEGTQVFLSLRADVQGGYLIERLLDLAETDEKGPDGKTTRRVAGRLPLDLGAPTNEIVFFFEPLPAPAAPGEGAPTAERQQ